MKTNGEYALHAPGGWLRGETYGEKSRTHPVVGPVLTFTSAEAAMVWKRKEMLSDGWTVRRLPSTGDTEAMFS